MNAKITETHGNSRNGIKGARVTVWNKAGKKVDSFEVPSRQGAEYCRKYPGGKYGKRFSAAIAEAN